VTLDRRVTTLGGAVLLRGAPPRMLRLDDLAYGAGLWWGAVRHRTLVPLLPAGPRLPRPESAPSESSAPNE
jgi:hypothetical protein